MTYVSLNITNRCNKACSYCINKDYINNEKYPDIMKWEDLRKWLDTLPDETIIEIPGTGEPTCCEWLPDLLDYLDKRNILSVLRTNGFGIGEWRRKFKKCLVILSRHDSSEEYVSEKRKHLLDLDIVIGKIKEDKIQKNVHSEFVNDELSPHISHGITSTYFITPDGKIRFMPCKPFENGTVWNPGNDDAHCLMEVICPFLLGIWNMIEYLKKPFPFKSDEYSNRLMRN